MGRRKETTPQKDKTPAWEKALAKISKGPLFKVAYHAAVYCNDRYPMAKTDWAYVNSRGEVFLNPHRDATPKEWEYVIAHCLLHLGFGHCEKDKLADPLWAAACDLVVAKFLRDSHIGTPPPDFRHDLPFVVKSEEQAYEWISEHRSDYNRFSFSTRTNRTDMVLAEREPRHDFTELLAESLQASMRDAIRESSGLPPLGRDYAGSTRYIEAREWFISSFPLLGALAASFRIVDDVNVLRRMEIPVAAVSAQMREIYINPRCTLNLGEWKFVLAHEFLHAALRHDLRCEDRDPQLWNVACDFVVNSWLVEMDVGVMPEFALFDVKFKGMSVEAVYDVVYADFRHYCKQSPGDILYGEAEWWDTLDGMEQDEFYRSAIQQGLTYHQEKHRGYLPADFIEEIRAISMPPIRWDVELAKWFDEQFVPVEKRRTYARMSRRQSACPDIPRPSWYLAEEQLESRMFGVVLDTSGSMDRYLLAAALGSIASYSEARDVKYVRVVFCDAAPYDQGIMSPDDLAGYVKVRGRGGTRLQPAIDLLDDDPKFPKDAPLLIITDGCCDRLNLRGRNHAYLVPWGYRLPFQPNGPMFKLK